MSTQDFPVRFKFPFGAFDQETHPNRGITKWNSKYSTLLKLPLEIRWRILNEVVTASRPLHFYVRTDRDHRLSTKRLEFHPVVPRPAGRPLICLQPDDLDYQLVVDESTIQRDRAESFGADRVLEAFGKTNSSHCKVLLACRQMAFEMHNQPIADPYSRHIYSFELPFDIETASAMIAIARHGRAYPWLRAMFVTSLPDWQGGACPKAEVIYVGDAMPDRAPFANLAEYLDWLKTFHDMAKAWRRWARRVVVQPYQIPVCDMIVGWEGRDLLGWHMMLGARWSDPRSRSEALQWLA